MTFAQTMSSLFSINQLLGASAVDGFSDAAWSTRVAPHANHAVWILVHVNQVRRGIARNLGAEIRDSEAPSAKFGDECLPADRYPSPAALIEEFTELGEEIVRRLETADAARLARTFEPTFPDGRDRTVQEALPFLAQHECLHLGQISLIRRLRDQRGIAEVMIERMAANA